MNVGVFATILEEYEVIPRGSLDADFIDKNFQRLGKFLPMILQSLTSKLAHETQESLKNLSPQIKQNNK